MRNRPKFLEGLSCGAIETAPVDIDWSSPDFEENHFYEAVECDACGAAVVISDGGGDCRHREWDSEAEHKGEPCDGWLPSADGPMMNYWYPVKLRTSVEDAARAISHLPLCIVEVNGETGLALTGGGMNLSWEVCAAFLALGFLPPTHFAGLPEMGGRGASASDRRLIRACEESFRVSMSWAQSGISRLKELRRTMRERAAARKAK